MKQSEMEVVVAGMSGQRVLEVELLRLEVAGCGRCESTKENLRAAMALLAPVLEEIGVPVVVRDLPVLSAQQAAEVRLVSSPTIRVNGHDIAGELTESGCGDCTVLVTGAQIGCRTWHYQGHAYTNAPVGLIIDGVLSGLYHQPLPEDPATYARLPDNLQTFFGAAS